MGAQAKIINLLLYDGTLSGVIRVENSSWNAGELFSSPRGSVSDLLKTGACNKYGVYLLLSADMVYVGQSSDLAKRLSQHNGNASVGTVHGPARDAEGITGIPAHAVVQ